MSKTTIDYEPVFVVHHATTGAKVAVRNRLEAIKLANLLNGGTPLSMLVPVFNSAGDAASWIQTIYGKKK